MLTHAGFMTLPLDLEDRLNCMSLSKSFSSRLKIVRETSEALSGACLEVRTSRLLLLVLKISLIVGNFLNSGAQQGSAVGFHLDTLLKLKDVKSTKSKKMSLLHFVAKEVKRQHGGGDCSLLSSLKACPLAAKINLTATREEIREIKTSLKLAEKVLQASEQEGEGRDSDSAFRTFLSTFHSQASSEMTEVEQLLCEAEKSFSLVASYLNGSGNKMEASPFFDLVTSFSASLDKCHAENDAFESALTSKKTKDEGGKEGRSKAGGLRASLSRRGGGGGGGGGGSHPMTPPKGQAGTFQHATVGTMHAKDDVMKQVRAYGALKPEDARSMLTEQGARERLRKHNITMRQSMATLVPTPSRRGGDSSDGGGGGGQVGVSRNMGLPPRTPKVAHRPPLQPPASSSKALGRGGDDLRSSVQGMLRAHFDARELVRLSAPSEEALRAILKAGRGEGGLHPSQSLKRVGSDHECSTINEESPTRRGTPLPLESPTRESPTRESPTRSQVPSAAGPKAQEVIERASDGEVASW